MPAPSVTELSLPGKPVYLDNHATTPVDQRVATVVMHYMTRAFGNASSVDHEYGAEAQAAIDSARECVAGLLGCAPRRVVFVSGATEALNLAIIGYARASGASKARPMRVVTSRIEHKAVLDPLRHLERHGLAAVRWTNVDHRGQPDLDDFRRLCHEGADLACIMTANNEIGTIAPIESLGAIAEAAGVPLLTDATQAAGKVPICFDAWRIGMLACSAHKLYGPKGVGALVVRSDLSLEPIMHGGGHQRGIRSGTLNVPGIAGFGEACRLRALEVDDDEARIAALRDSLQLMLEESIEGLSINGDARSRLAGNLHISVNDVPSSVIVARLKGKVALARGAACSSIDGAPSHVLHAIGLHDSAIRGALRIGIGKFTTADEIEYAAGAIIEAIRTARVVSEPALSLQA